MTYIFGLPVTLGYVFPLFQHYWLNYRQYENDIITQGKFQILHSRVFEKLE